MDPLKALRLYCQKNFPEPSKGRKLLTSLCAMYLILLDLFSNINPGDKLYVTVFRLLFFSSMEKFGLNSVAQTYHFHAGRSLGAEMTKEKVVRTVDDIFRAFFKYKLGLVDIVKENTNTTVINIYEYISCSGLLNIGKPVCFFEARVLSSILEHFMGKIL